MDRIVVTSIVGDDGVLHLTLPLEKADAHREVQVTIEPMPAVTPVKQMTQEEWRKRVLSTAGRWQGELERPEQLPLEERDPL